MNCPECGCEMNLIENYDPPTWKCPKCKCEIEPVEDEDTGDNYYDDSDVEWEDV